MKIVQKTLSSEEDSQQLLDSEDEKQAEIDVEIQFKIRLKKHKIQEKNQDCNRILIEKF